MAIVEVPGARIKKYRVQVIADELSKVERTCSFQIYRPFL
jgi:hypothetical protein